MLFRLNVLLYVFNEVDFGDWQKFVKKGFKFWYQDYIFLKMFFIVVQFLYSLESFVCMKFIQFLVVYVMFMQYLLFLLILLMFDGEESLDS